MTGAVGEDFQPQYVHCTGGMFVLLRDNKTTSPRNRDGTHRSVTLVITVAIILEVRINEHC